MDLKVNNPRRNEYRDPVPSYSALDEDLDEAQTADLEDGEKFELKSRRATVASSKSLAKKRGLVFQEDCDMILLGC
jgi:hypothetical protein